MNAACSGGICGIREKWTMIHQYKLGGYNIVLDVCSGSVHVVDDAAYDIIALMDAGIEVFDESRPEAFFEHLKGNEL